MHQGRYCEVSSQYCSGSFLFVWYRHGTDSGDFHKNFDAHKLVFVTSKPFQPSVL